MRARTWRNLAVRLMSGTDAYWSVPKHIVLAYSGGLDTSVMVHWLKANHNAKVTCAMLDLGQGPEAIRAYRDYLALEPRQSEMRLELARLLRETPGRLAQARQELVILLSFDRHNKEASDMLTAVTKEMFKRPN